MAHGVALDLAFADPEDAMGDWEQVDPPEVSTPEHWSDVGALSARMGLVEQQLQNAQAQLSQMASQMAAASHSLQHLEMQMVLQRQQHQEDMVKMMAAQAVSLSNLTPGTRTKARPGPRERQKLREERRVQEMDEAQVQAASSTTTTTLSATAEPDAQSLTSKDLGPPSSVCDTDAGLSELSEERHAAPTVSEDANLKVLQENKCAPLPAAEAVQASGSGGGSEKTQPLKNISFRWSSWCCVILAWGLYFARDLTAVSDLGVMQAFDAPIDPELAASMATAQAAGFRLRELGHLQLSVSDCSGASKLFARAEALLGNSSAPYEHLSELRRERGFALVCAQSFHEGAALLREALWESTQTSSLIHLPALTDESEQPLSGPVHFMNALSFAHFHLGEFSRARSVLESAVELYPDNPLIWNNLGAVYIALGDLVRADEALHRALARAARLTNSDHSIYYQQLVSNNIHTQRRHSQGDTSIPPLLEIFNCMVTEVSDMVASTAPVQLKQQYQALEADAAAAGVDATSVVWTSRAVLSMEREFVLCP